jgi:hypothetical protein
MVILSLEDLLPSLIQIGWIKKEFTVHSCGAAMDFHHFPFLLRREFNQILIKLNRTICSLKLKYRANYVPHLVIFNYDRMIIKNR